MTQTRCFFLPVVTAMINEKAASSPAFRTLAEVLAGDNFCGVEHLGYFITCVLLYVTT